MSYEIIEKLRKSQLLKEDYRIRLVCGCSFIILARNNIKIHYQLRRLICCEISKVHCQGHTSNVISYIIIDLHQTKFQCKYSQPTFRTHVQYNKDGHIVTDRIHLLNVHSPLYIMYAVQNEHNLANNPQYLAL